MFLTTGSILWDYYGKFLFSVMCISSASKQFLSPATELIMIVMAKLMKKEKTGRIMIRMV